MSILAALTVCLSGCRGSGQDVASQAALQRDADMHAIEQIEMKWHQASSTKDLDLMMSLWAGDATFTVGGETYTGKEQIRNFFETLAGPFQPGNEWVSDTPAYKERVTLDGDTGGIYFECDYVDVKTSKVVAVVSADNDLQRIAGNWLITNSVAATAELSV